MTKANWKDTAELIGIAAIVASLIFVGLQMRQEQELARIESIGEYVASGVDFRIGLTEYSDLLVRGNSGDPLSDAELHQLRQLMEIAEDRVYFESLKQSQLGSSNSTGEMKFASFLYRNRAAREAWLQHAADTERYVDPLRTPESLERTRSGGSNAFRDRIKDYLTTLDQLYPER